MHLIEKSTMISVVSYYGVVDSMLLISGAGYKSGIKHLKQWFQWKKIIIGRIPVTSSMPGRNSEIDLKIKNKCSQTGQIQCPIPTSKSTNQIDKYCNRWKKAKAATWLPIVTMSF